MELLKNYCYYKHYKRGRCRISSNPKYLMVQVPIQEKCLTFERCLQENIMTLVL